MSTLLEDLFKITEEDSESFVEHVKKFTHTKEDELLSKIISTDADQVEPQAFIIHQSGKIKIEHGPHGDHYVFHISPLGNSKLRCSEELFIHSIAMIMNKTIPSSIMVDIFLPQSDWDIKEYTFKAINFTGDWRFNPECINKIIGNLLTGLNAIS